MPKTEKHYHIMFTDHTLMPNDSAENQVGPVGSKREANRIAFRAVKAQSERERKPLAGKRGSYTCNYTATRVVACSDPECWYRC